MSDPEPWQAVDRLASELEAAEARAVLLFCSNQYDLERLGPLIAERFRVPVAGCTTAGQIGPSGFERGGITGVAFHGGDLRLRPLLFSPLSLCQSQAQSFARDHAARLAKQPGLKSFGVLLVDGNSMSEEFLAAAVYQAFGNVSLVGGSAATDVPAREPAVYHAGRFFRGAAVLALFETESVPFATFVVQHFAPSSKKLVITQADPEQRVIHEINGEAAALVYARALGVSQSQLSAEQFAAHPLMLTLGDHHLPRAIRERRPDGSLLLRCALEEGLVVSIGESKDPLRTLDATLADVGRRVSKPAALLAFDCVARRTELEARGLADSAGRLLAGSRAVGFNGFGAQLGPLHCNHTLTGIALGSGEVAGNA